MDPFRCGYGPCGVGHGDNRGWSWLGLIDSIALWLLLIAAVLVVVALIRRAGGRAAFVRRFPAGIAPTGAGPTGWAPAVPPHIAQAEATLADRFARGEISAWQYQDQLAVLRGQPQQAGATAAAAPAASYSAGPESAAPYSAAADSAAPESTAPDSTGQPPAGPAANP
jgi:putative membrane protein